MRSILISRRFKMKIRCYTGRIEDCEKNRIKTWQWIRSDNLDLLIFTNGSVNEECSEVEAAFVVRKIKDDQIWKFKSVNYSRKYMLLFSSRNAEIDLKWLLQQRSQWKTVKLITIIKLSSFKSIQNRTIDK